MNLIYGREVDLYRMCSHHNPFNTIIWFLVNSFIIYINGLQMIYYWYYNSHSHRGLYKLVINNLHKQQFNEKSCLYIRFGIIFTSIGIAYWRCNPEYPKNRNVWWSSVVFLWFQCVDRQQPVYRENAPLCRTWSIWSDLCESVLETSDLRESLSLLLNYWSELAK